MPSPELTSIYLRIILSLIQEDRTWTE